MSLLKKSILGLSGLLAAAFCFITLLTSIGIVKSNKQIVTSITDKLENDNQITSQHLYENSERTLKELQAAGEKTQRVILDLYSSSYKAITQAVANQIFPMVENFDIDTPQQIITALMESNPEIKWVRYATSESPQDDEIFSFGTNIEGDDVKTFTHQLKTRFSFMKLEMTVGLSGLKALKTIDDIFAKINNNNNEMIIAIQKGSESSLLAAKNHAEEIAGYTGNRIIRNIIIMMLTVLAIVCLMLSMFIKKNITIPIGKTVEMISELAKGHLNLRLNMKRTDEIGTMSRTMDEFANSLQHEVVETLQKLAHGDLTFDAIPKDTKDVIRGSLRKTGEDLNSILSQIYVTGENVLAASSEISSSSQSLSQASSEAAIALEQITNSMSEINNQTESNAGNANQANQLSTQAREFAEKGNIQMEEMVRAMDEINDSSQNISKIIKVIDEIAFQTNLLALNAAVEAARAGRQGKGFAVVAEEVRNLAARSARAAGETAEMIESSVEKTRNGSKIANRTAEALQEIMQEITKATSLVGEIAKSSNQQVRRINEINEGLDQIDKVTQQNTASAEESAAAASELSFQAKQLHGMLNHFQLSDDVTRRSPLPTEREDLDPEPLKKLDFVTELA